MSKGKRMALSDQVREAVDSTELSRHAICNAIGLDRAVMSRFMSGKGGLSLDTLDRLAAFLHLSIVAGRRRQDPKR